MSTIDSGVQAGATGPYAEPEGAGWIVFAGIMMMIVAILNVIYGIAAIGNAKFFVGNHQFIISDLKTWGWVTLIIGVLMTLAGVGILLGNGAARWLGVAFAFLSAMAHFGTISSFPLWGVMVIAIDITIIYTLTARWMPDF